MKKGKASWVDGEDAKNCVDAIDKQALSNADDYLRGFHFTVSEECSFHQIQAAPGIRLEIRKGRIIVVRTERKKCVRICSKDQISYEEDALGTRDKQAKKFYTFCSCYLQDTMGMPLVVLSMNRRLLV